MESDDEDGSGHPDLRLPIKNIGSPVSSAAEEGLEILESKSVKDREHAFAMIRDVLIKSRLIKEPSFKKQIAQFSDEKLDEHFNSESKVAFLVFDEGNLAAFLLGEDEDAVGYLTWLIVEPQYKGRGLGRKLVSLFESWLRKRDSTKMYADVDPYNDEAIRFYDTLGFIREAYLKKHWYKEDCYIYSKFLS